MFADSGTYVPCRKTFALTDFSPYICIIASLRVKHFELVLIILDISYCQLRNYNGFWQFLRTGLNLMN